jgi:DNA-binding transcriptional LysR family regulator
MASANLERLELLHAVAMSGTIAAAARASAYTASAVSQQLSALEREVGTTLLERSNRGVTLTPAGRLLSERAAIILDLVDSTLADVTQTARSATPTAVRIGAFPTAISSMLLPVVQPLVAVVRLQIVDLEPEAALAALRERRIDAAIVDRYDHADKTSAVPTGLDSTTLVVEPIRLVHPANRRCRSIESLADARWVLGGLESRLGRAAREICGANGFTPDVIVESDDHHVAFDVIASTGAFALLPERALRSLPRGIAAARSLDTGAQRRIDFVTRHIPLPNRAVSALEAALHHAVGRS